MTKKYIYGPGIDNPIVMIYVTGGTETWYYYYTDALGSVRLITDHYGVIKEGYTYSPFGRAFVMYGINGAGTDGNWLTEDTTSILPYSPLGNPYMFTARRWDSYANLYYYRFRDYQPDLGRFCQPDPIGYSDSMNLYAYCNNNPLNWIDPWGLSITYVDRIYVPDGDMSSAGEAMQAFNNMTGAASRTVGAVVEAVPKLTAWQKLMIALGISTVSDYAYTPGPEGSGSNKEYDKDIKKNLKKFKKQSLKKQKKAYEKLNKTYKEHLKTYKQKPGETIGEVNRIERELKAMRDILIRRGQDIPPLY